MEWTKFNGGFEAVSENGKYDFVIDTQGKPVCVFVFLNDVDDNSNAFYHSFEADSLEEAFEECKGWK